MPLEINCPRDFIRSPSPQIGLKACGQHTVFFSPEHVPFEDKRIKRFYSQQKEVSGGRGKRIVV
jgi:hypothetical protein